MKIAMVSEHASPLAVLGGVDAGGQNVHVAELAGALVRAGHEVAVYTRRDDPRTAYRTWMPSGVEVVQIEAGPVRPINKDLLLRHMDAFSERLVEAWRRECPHIVHAHFWMSGRAALAAASEFALPVVQTFHALGSEKRRMQGARDHSPPEREEEERAIVLRAHAVIATATSELFELRRLGADSENLRIVPCGVDIDAFRQRVDTLRFGRRRRRFRIVTLSRLVERKGVADVVCALKELPDVELLIAGGGETADLAIDAEVQRLSMLAREIGVAKQVRFVGRVAREAVPAYLHSADVVCCTPWYEPFGIVAVEAMACGIPVIATAVGGLNDTIVHNVTGMHVPVRDPEAIAAAVQRMLGDEDFRMQLGSAAASRAERLYSWARIARKTAEVYALLLQRAKLGTEHSA